MDLKVIPFNKEFTNKFNISNKSIVVNLTFFVPPSFRATRITTQFTNRFVTSQKYKFRSTMKKGEIDYKFCN